jgi:hypothetical protein
MTTYDTLPLVAELKEKKLQNLLVFGATLPGCPTFCTEILCTKSATVVGYHYRKTGRFLWRFKDFFTTANWGFIIARYL